MGGPGSGGKRPGQKRTPGGTFLGAGITIDGCDQVAREKLRRKLEKLDLTASADRAKYAAWVAQGLMQNALTTTEGRTHRELLAELRQEAAVAQFARELEEIRQDNAALKLELAEAKRAMSSAAILLPADGELDACTTSTRAS